MAWRRGGLANPEWCCDTMGQVATTTVGGPGPAPRERIRHHRVNAEWDRSPTPASPPSGLRSAPGRGKGTLALDWSWVIPDLPGQTNAN